MFSFARNLRRNSPTSLQFNQAFTKKINELFNENDLTLSKKKVKDPDIYLCSNIPQDNEIEILLMKGFKNVHNKIPKENDYKRDQFYVFRFEDWDNDEEIITIIGKVLLIRRLKNKSKKSFEFVEYSEFDKCEILCQFYECSFQNDEIELVETNEFLYQFIDGNTVELDLNKENIYFKPSNLNQMKNIYFINSKETKEIVDHLKKFDIKIKSIDNE